MFAVVCVVMGCFSIQAGLWFPVYQLIDVWTPSQGRTLADDEIARETNQTELFTATFSGYGVPV